MAWPFFECTFVVNVHQKDAINFTSYNLSSLCTNLSMINENKKNKDTTFFLGIF